MKSRPSRQFEPQLHAQGEDLVDLRADQVPREAVLGHALVQHPAHDRRRVEEGHAVPEQREVVGAAHAGRAGPHHGDPRRRPALSRRQAQRAERSGRRAQRVLHAVPLGDHALQGADRDRLVDEAAAALASRRGARRCGRRSRPAGSGPGPRSSRAPYPTRRSPGRRRPRSCGPGSRPGRERGPGILEVRNDRRVGAFGHAPGPALTSPG